jgi:hypothetical protein
MGWKLVEPALRAAARPVAPLQCQAHGRGHRLLAPGIRPVTHACISEAAQVGLCRPEARGADPIPSRPVHGRDLCESCLGQEVPVLCVTQECGAQQRHSYAVE